MPKAQRDHARNAERRTSAGVPRDNTEGHPARDPRRQVHQCAKRTRSPVSCAGTPNRAACETTYGTAHLAERHDRVRTVEGRAIDTVGEDMSSSSRLAKKR
jgi:hypothetical protein